jgi:spermidine/putrescine transport system permease protein
LKKSRLPLYITLSIISFFYLPLVIMSVNSFNDTRYGGQWHGFTLKWYGMIFNDAKLWDNLFNSLIIAASSTCASIFLGTLSAYALYRYSGRLQQLHNLLLYTPLVFPDILMGISLLIFFVSMKIQLGLMTIFLAHTTFCISYVAMVVLSRLQDFDYTLIEAAMDLGASWPRAILRVMVPYLMPGIVAGGLMAFTLSIDDFVVSFFVTGPGSATLPIYIYSMMKHGTPTIINALSVIMIVITFLIIIATKKLLEVKN